MATIQVRVDDELKQRADALFADIGLDTSSAIRLFLKQSLNCNGIPFSLRADPYAAYVERALAEADEEARNPGPRTDHQNFMQEMRAYLHELASTTDGAV